jgi:hypothetical protein
VLGVDHVRLPTVSAEVVEVEDPFASSTARSRQVSASAPRDVGVTVAARQYLVA